MCLETASHVVDPLYPGVVDEIINLGDYWDSKYLRQNKKEIIETSEHIKENFDTGYKNLARAGEIYQKWQNINQQLLLKEKLVSETDKIIDEIFRSQTPRSRHFFSSAITNKGLINLTDALSKQYAVRYILRGEPGSGKDILLEKIAYTAQNRGHYAEIYHNAFMPQQIEMLLLPDLEVAIIAESDNQHDSWQEEDRIIDMGQFLAQNCNLDESQTTNDLKTQFWSLVKEASENISQAKALHDDLEYYYRKAMDFEKVDEVSNKLLNKVVAFAAKREK
ncbi:MAG: hypothetical protein ACOX7H_01620 [Bacillota bacterium]